MSEQQGGAPAPWYRQFWPWALMAGPLLVVIAGSYTAWLAAQSPDALVVDDYYKEGRAINASLHRDAQALKLGLSATLHFPDHAGGDVRVEMNSTQSQAWPPALTLVLTHPVKAQFDQTIELRIAGAQSDAAVYVGQVAPLEHIAYQVTLEDIGKQWRLLSDRRGAAREVVQLRAGVSDSKPATKEANAPADN